MSHAIALGFSFPFYYSPIFFSYSGNVFIGNRICKHVIVVEGNSDQQRARKNMREMRRDGKVRERVCFCANNQKRSRLSVSEPMTGAEKIF